MDRSLEMLDTDLQEVSDSLQKLADSHERLLEAARQALSFIQHEHAAHTLAEDFYDDTIQKLRKAIKKGM